MIHSLYSNKEIFLRELISNASDALDQLRFEALTAARPPTRSGEMLEIRLEADADGAHAHDLRQRHRHEPRRGGREHRHHRQVGHARAPGAARAGRRMPRDSAAELIGQFGVGFYSAFMVADRVDAGDAPRRRGEGAPAGSRPAARASFTIDDDNRVRPRHHDHAPPEADDDYDTASRTSPTRAVIRAHRQAALGLRRLPDPHGKDQDPQLDEADLDAARVGGHRTRSTRSSTTTSRTTGASR